TLEECRQLIEQAPERGARFGRGKRAAAAPAGQPSETAPAAQPTKTKVAASRADGGETKHPARAANGRQARGAIAARATRARARPPDPKVSRVIKKKARVIPKKKASA